ncbi:MAG: hypothetical protein COA96_07295 [SAR86 cluster bacterium]|uniref:Uncharacterized protein n=1 Tax=SAR86 cluster bacterium TaxID=2030880 RepID=A0A2A5B1Q1_9GAMM|nr:MAG: hypothetical protein COA96_07295 [SAR86 cluster bacterium]
MTATNNPGFYPFYDPYRGGELLGYSGKLAISVSVGTFYLLLQYFSLADKTVLFTQYCWVLAAIISTSLFSLYVATDIFRRSLTMINTLEGRHAASNQVVADWLNNKWYFLSGLGFATTSITTGHFLGIPLEFYETPYSLFAMYMGLFLAGFTSGMGLLSIVAVIILYLKFVPNLQYSLDPHNPDGFGGIKKLGDSLWFFGGLAAAVGILVSIHMFGVSWTNTSSAYVQLLFLMWIAMPYIVAISIVLIPGLAVRRQVAYYKTYKSQQLKQEKIETYSSYKQFDSNEDDVIIAEKKELHKKLNRIQNDLDKLEEMRNSHIDVKD